MPESKSSGVLNFVQTIGIIGSITLVIVQMNKNDEQEMRRISYHVCETLFTSDVLTKSHNYYRKYLHNLESKTKFNESEFNKLSALTTAGDNWRDVTNNIKIVANYLEIASNIANSGAADREAISHCLETYATAYIEVIETHGASPCSHTDLICSASSFPQLRRFTSNLPNDNVANIDQPPLRETKAADSEQQK